MNNACFEFYYTVSSGVFLEEKAKMMLVGVG